MEGVCIATLMEGTQGPKSSPATWVEGSCGRTGHAPGALPQLGALGLEDPPVREHLQQRLGGVPVAAAVAPDVKDLDDGVAMRRCPMGARLITAET